MGAAKNQELDMTTTRNGQVWLIEPDEKPVQSCGMRQALQAPDPDEI